MTYLAQKNKKSWGWGEVKSAACCRCPSAHESFIHTGQRPREGVHKRGRPNRAPGHVAHVHRLRAGRGAAVHHASHRAHGLDVPHLPAGDRRGTLQIQVLRLWSTNHEGEQDFNNATIRPTCGVDGNMRRRWQQSEMNSSGHSRAEWCASPPLSSDAFRNSTGLPSVLEDSLLCRRLRPAEKQKPNYRSQAVPRVNSAHSPVRGRASRQQTESSYIR